MTMTTASERAKRHRAAILRVIERLDDSKIEELCQRGRFPASPLRSGPSIGSVGEHSDPTLATVVQHGGGGEDEEGNQRPDDWRDYPDPAGRALDEILGALAEAAGVLCGENGAERKIAYVEAVPIDREARAKELPGAGDCNACGKFCSGARSDRIVSGYCDPCLRAWIRAGRSDRAEFERKRRESAA